MKKNFIVFLMILLFLFGYKFVYSNFFINQELKLLSILSKNIYVDSEKLNSTIVGFSSNFDISNYQIYSSCDTETEFLYNNNSNYYFLLKVNDLNCKNNNFFLKNDKIIFTNTNFKLNLISYFDLFNKYTDFDTDTLSKLSQKISDLKDRYKIFASINNFINNDFLKKQRFYQELEYQNNIIKEIIEKRSKKYIIPVIGYNLPTRKDKLPNFLRKYRDGHTNGIHQGWDIDAPLGTPVVSASDGIILRIVNDFKFSDLYKIKKDGEITDEDKLLNLDLYRGNQVWLKTPSGDVFIYAHLDKVFSDVKVGDFIKSKTPIGTIGITGVPDKNYNDYHLHFEIKKNPYYKTKAGKYSFLDIMRWDWYFKGEDINYILENQYNIFEKN